MTQEELIELKAAGYIQHTDAVTLEYHTLELTNHLRKKLTSKKRNRTKANQIIKTILNLCKVNKIIEIAAAVKLMIAFHNCIGSLSDD